jgi:hypothetical protein
MSIFVCLSSFAEGGKREKREEDERSQGKKRDTPKGYIILRKVKRWISI